MTVVHSPQAPHDCRIGWQMVDGSFLDVHGTDRPGTVRQCQDCARCWVAVPWPRARAGQQQTGVTWRLERPRERRRRIREARRLGPVAKPPTQRTGRVDTPPGRGMHLDPQQVPTTLHEPATDAGQPAEPFSIWRGLNHYRAAQAGDGVERPARWPDGEVQDDGTIVYRFGLDTRGEVRAYTPHCDSSILHAPGECEACDEYPDWQAFRTAQRISFTGQTDPDRAPCPSEHFRPAETRDQWPGNRRWPAP